MRLVQIAEEIIAALAADPNAEVKVRIEIEANFASGARDEAISIRERQDTRIQHCRMGVTSHQSDGVHQFVLIAATASWVR